MQKTNIGLKVFLFIAILYPKAPFAQWMQTGGPEGGVTIHALLASGTNLFAGTYHHSVYLSINYGTNWTAVNSGLLNTAVYSLSVGGTNLFAGTGDDGVFLSIDNDKSWTAVNAGLRYLDVYSLTVASMNLFAGTNSGVFFSTDNGTNWTTVDSGLTGTGVLSPLIENRLSAGEHLVSWDARNIANGCYTIKINDGAKTQNKVLSLFH